MGVFKIGDTVRIMGGGTARILDEFGAGGQGTVYKVSYNGKEYALKWYHEDVFRDKKRGFYDNLKKNIEKGAPTDAFLWPLYITEEQNGSFGYIMNVRPEGYEELTNFFVDSRKKGQVKFKEFQAIATAAINIIQAFRELHKRGYSYQDINNGNFFIDPTDGKVLICDNDNVSPFGENLGIMGKQRWMAPEIVTNKSEPDTHSDRFSLAVVLFRLLFINHPLEGKYSTPPCMTKEMEKRYYGIEPIFVYDPNDDRNRPIKGTDANLKLFWNAYPQYIRDLFVRAFSSEVMQKQKPRVLEKEWLDAFFRLKAEIGKCPVCSKETFFTAEGMGTCIQCKKQIVKMAGLKLKKYQLPIHNGMKIYLWHVDDAFDDIETVTGEVIANPKNPNLLGIRNLSKNTWRVSLLDGSQRAVESMKVVPVQNGFVIDFYGNNQATAEIQM